MAHLREASTTIEFLRSPVKILILALVGATMAAGLMASQADVDPRPRPRPMPPLGSQQVLGRAATAPRYDVPLVLDVETGRLDPLALPPGVSLDSAAMSSREEDGRRQVVGLGWGYAADGSGSPISGIGLVRMSLPDGEVLGHSPLHDAAVPTGPPCLIPGDPTGVLYVGGDGRLYWADLAPIDEPGSAGSRPLAWPASTASPGEAHVKDLSWPAAEWLGGRALATVWFADREDQVWWLEFDADATSIVAAGRLLETEASGGPTDIRFPIAARFADGVPALAEGCLSNLPAPSRDGGWITVLRADGEALEARRVAVPSHAPTTLAGRASSRP